jgi:hypothetical protein
MHKFIQPAKTRFCEDGFILRDQKNSEYWPNMTLLLNSIITNVWGIVFTFVNTVDRRLSEINGTDEVRSIKLFG